MASPSFRRARGASRYARDDASPRRSACRHRAAPPPPRHAPVLRLAQRRRRARHALRALLGVLLRGAAQRGARRALDLRVERLDGVAAAARVALAKDGRLAGGGGGKWREGCGEVTKLRGSRVGVVCSAMETRTSRGGALRSRFSEGVGCGAARRGLIARDGRLRGERDFTRRALTHD
jgi:hypothetical protein